MKIPSPSAALPALALLLAGLLPASLSAQQILGFDLSNATVPPDDILRGGPPPDGIPAIDEPRFLPAGEVDWLGPEDEVLGFVRDGEARAYPVRILNWHEIVNDTVAGLPIAVTYCPLCASGMIFSREVDGATLRFGVSGLLLHSDMLLFDRATRSLWSQIGTDAISGAYAGTHLQWLPSEQMSWPAWRERYPDSRVLSRDTGHDRNYGRDPYRGYAEREGTMFPAPRHRGELPRKTLVAGLLLHDEPLALPLGELPAGRSFTVEHAGSSLSLRYEPETFRLEVRDAAGQSVPTVQSFWFAWQSFYPDTALWRGENESPGSGSG